MTERPPRRPASGGRGIPVGPPRSARKGIKLKLPGDMGCKVCHVLPSRSSPTPAPTRPRVGCVYTACHTHRHTHCMFPARCTRARMYPHLHSRSRRSHSLHATHADQTNITHNILYLSLGRRAMHARRAAV